MRFTKHHLALLMGGLVVIGAASYVLAQDVPTSDEVTLTQSEQAADAGRPGGRPQGRPELPRALRAEAVVPSRDGDGFETVKLDRGVLQRIDGTTLVIEEEDGTVVEIATDDETRIGRDGERATVDDLKSGDHIFAIRVKEGDAFVTKGVRAVSPEKFEQFNDRQNDRRPRRPGSGRAS